MQKTKLYAKLILISILLTPIVSAVYMDFYDDYDYHGTTGDYKTFINQPIYYTAREITTDVGDALQVVIFERDSGQELLEICEDDDLGYCEEEIGIGNSCGGIIGDYDDYYSIGINNNTNETDEIQMRVYWEDDGECYTVIRTQKRYYITAQKIYKCYINQSGYTINGSSIEYGSTGTYNYEIGQQTCPQNHYCVNQNITYENYDDNITTDACIECGEEQKEFINYCKDINTYVTLKRNNNSACGSTQWQINETQECTGLYFCDYSKKTVTSYEELENPCMTHIDQTEMTILDNWYNILESTTTDHLSFKNLNINLTVTPDEYNRLKPNITCIVDQSTTNYLYAWIQINGEYLLIQQNEWEEITDSEEEIKLYSADLQYQRANIRMKDGDEIDCGILPITLYNTSDSHTKTMECGGHDYEITLFMVDYTYYDVCYGSQQMIQQCYNISKNKDSNLQEYFFYDLNNTFPERINNTVEALSTYIMNLTKTGIHNITTKYITGCQEDDIIQQIGYEDNYTRYATIWSQTIQMTIIENRTRNCTNQTNVHIYTTINKENITINDYNCEIGQQCIAINITSDNYTYTFNDYLCEAIPNCTNGYKDGTETKPDFGGICGNCFDKVKNNRETEIDYGGTYCGNCSTTGKQEDTAWILYREITQEEFKQEQCTIGQTSIITIIIILFTIILFIIFILLIIWAIYMYLVVKISKLAYLILKTMIKKAKQYITQR